MKKLTKKQREEYIAHPNYCPYCESEEVSSGNFESDDNYGWRDAHCEDCNKNWQDLYTLTGIAEENA